MLTIRDLLRVGVVRLRRLLALPRPFAAVLLLDSWQYRPLGSWRTDLDVGNWVRGVLEAGVEGTGERAVQEDGWVVASHGVPRAVDVAGVLGHEPEHVGADVPAAEGVEVPVGLNSGDV